MVEISVLFLINVLEYEEEGALSSVGGIRIQNENTMITLTVELWVTQPLLPVMVRLPPPTRYYTSPPSPVVTSAFVT